METNADWSPYEGWELAGLRPDDALARRGDRGSSTPWSAARGGDSGCRARPPGSRRRRDAALPAAGAAVPGPAPGARARDASGGSAVDGHSRLPARRTSASSPLWNPDLAPTPPERRTWSTYNIAALWIGMSVVITTYTLASGLMQQGMNWWQAMVTILLGNTIVLVPMVLNAHAGTKYGISFPVLCRASFGVRGANLPAMLRAIVACGWFGIQTWIGGLALDALCARRGRAGPAVPGSTAIAFMVVLADPGRRDPQGHRGDQAAGELVGAAAAGRRRDCSSGGRSRAGGGLGASARPSRSGCSGGSTPFWALFPAALTAQRRLLGHAEPQHPRLHPLRQEPALPDAGPGARAADHDDGVRVHRRGGHQRHHRALRRGDLGSGGADRADRRRRA